MLRASDIRALTQAIAEAKKSNNHLLVINSSKGDALVDNRYAQEPDIQGIEQRLATQGISHTITQPVRGHDAAAEVLDAADEHHADLIVIGQFGVHNPKPTDKNVPNRVLQAAVCPTLVVGMPDEADLSPRCPACVIVREDSEGDRWFCDDHLGSGKRLDHDMTPMTTWTHGALMYG